MRNKSRPAAATAARCDEATVAPTVLRGDKSASTDNRYVGQAAFPTPSMHQPMRAEPRFAKKRGWGDSAAQVAMRAVYMDRSLDERRFSVELNRQGESRDSSSGFPRLMPPRAAQSDQADHA